jgi:hypothetical protein
MAISIESLASRVNQVARRHAAPELVADQALAP